MEELLEAPIPGQSLTDEPNNWPWENPPEMADPEEATKYYINRLANDEVMDDLAVALDGGTPLTPLVKTLVTSGTMNGLHSIDVGLIISPVIHSFIKAAMTSYGVKVVDDLVDPEEVIKENEKRRLQIAIELAVAESKTQGPDEGVALLETLQDTLSEQGTEEEVETAPDMAVKDEQAAMEASEEVTAAPVGLMARGA